MMFLRKREDKPCRDAVDDAWRIHSAISDWTNSVDFKASLVLTVESALMAGLVTLSSKGFALADLRTNAQLWWYRAGIAVLCAAVLFAAVVVRPRLRSRDMKSEQGGNYIFFGHAKSWTPKRLERALRDQDILPVLTRQIVNMSQIAWKKHRNLQTSITLAVVACVCVGVAGWLRA